MASDKRNASDLAQDLASRVCDMESELRALRAHLRVLGREVGAAEDADPAEVVFLVRDRLRGQVTAG